MSALLEIEIQIDKNTKKTFTVSINDDTKYNRNVSVYVPQTEEERKTQQKKDYVGGGVCFWTDGKINTYTKEE